MKRPTGAHDILIVWSREELSIDDWIIPDVRSGKSDRAFRVRGNDNSRQCDIIARRRRTSLEELQKTALQKRGSVYRI